MGPHRFNPNPPNMDGIPDGYYRLGDSIFYICPPAGGGLASHYGIGPLVDGIDRFAVTCIHENAHLTYYFQYWDPVGGWHPDLDRNGDGLRDDTEPALGYDPSKQDTNGDGVPDGEDFACRAEWGWVIGSADHEDWACPGHQY